MAIHLKYSHLIDRLELARGTLSYNERVLHVFGWEHGASDLREASDHINSALHILYGFRDGDVAIKKPEEVG